MTPIRLLAAAAVSASALIAAPAFAQDPAATEDAVNMPATQPAAAPSADQSGTPASAMTVDPATGATVIRQSSVSPEQAATLKAGDANVVTNGPVPDTRENRALYGAPISNGGKRTAPAGN